MLPSSAPLVPDDQDHYERDFIPRDLDQERDRRNRPSRRSRPAPIQNLSFGKRILKTIVRFCAAVLIGIGLTLSWQSYAEETKELVQSWAPALAWLLPAANPNKPADTSSSDLMQQIKLLSVDVAIVRRNLAQLTAGQEQMAGTQDHINQNIMSVQQAVQEIRDQAAVAPLATKPAPPRLRSAPQPGSQASPR